MREYGERAEERLTKVQSKYGIVASHAAMLVVGFLLGAWIF